MASVRFGLIGYGAWGSHHARAIAAVPDAVLVAIAARSEANRQAAATAHPQARLYADYRQMLDGEQLDVVSVVLPSDLHFEVGRDVLESGRHLLTEKPMALRVEQCSEMIELAERRGRWIAVGHELRFSPLWGKVKQLIDAGSIGEPLYQLIELWRRPYRPGAGELAVRDRPSRQLDARRADPLLRFGPLVFRPAWRSATRVCPSDRPAAGSSRADRQFFGDDDVSRRGVRGCFANARRLGTSSNG